MVTQVIVTDMDDTPTTTSY